MEAEVKASSPRALVRRYKEGEDQAPARGLVVAYLPLVKLVAAARGARLPRTWIRRT